MTGIRARPAGEAAPPLIAVALISAAALAFEILLMRLFSIILWHHFAYMIISLALLGYGASGALLTVAQSAVQRHFAPMFCTAAAAFGASAIGCFVLAQRVPFNPLEILWDPRQPAYLLGVYLLLALPFLCAGACACMAYSRWRGMASRIYSFDILGAGAGSLAVMGLLFVLSPQDALKLIGALGFAAAAVAWLECGGPRRWPAAVLMVMAGLPLLLPPSWVAPAMSPYKELSQTLRIPQARVVEERFSPLGLVSVVESPSTPLRHAPGLSLNATAEPPPQLGVFIDGEGMSALTRFDGRRDSLAHLGQMTSALPYHLLRRPRVLVLGAGAGADVLQAHYHGARQIDAVELNPQVVDLVRRQFADYAGGIYSGGADSQISGIVRVHGAEARGFVAASKQRYDLIHVALLDSFSASSAGLYALSENYLYTVQALQDDLRHLEHGGLLAITRWVVLPPRDALKLFAAAVVALERSGVADPASRLALVRSWQTSTLLVKNGAFSGEDIVAIKAFCNEHSFDVAFYPGMKPQEANRYNVVAPPDLFEGATALLGTARDEFVRSYKFHIAPATDDKPHFFHFFKWRSLPELLSLKEQGGLPLLEWGYPVLVATLVQAVAREPAADRGTCGLGHLGRRPAARQRAARRFAPPCAGLLCGDRLRLHVHRNRVHPEVRSLPEPPALRGGGRAVRVSAVRRNRQRRLQAFARRQRADAAARGGGSGGSDCAVGGAVPEPASLAVRERRRAAGLTEDRDLGRTHCAAGVLHGHAIPDRAGEGGGRRCPACPLGLGDQRLRIGHRCGACHAACDPYRVHRRGRRCTGALYGRGGGPALTRPSTRRAVAQQLRGRQARADNHIGTRSRREIGGAPATLASHSGL